MTVFVDANIAMYLVGAPHPNRERAQVLLDELILADTRLVTDAEVFQEVLHRYAAIQRREAIEPAFAVLKGIIDEVLSIGVAEIDDARGLVEEGAGARDAIHVSAMRLNSVSRILTFDRGFDRFEDLERIS